MANSPLMHVISKKRKYSHFIIQRKFLPVKRHSMFYSSDLNKKSIDINYVPSIVDITQLDVGNHPSTAKDLFMGDNYGK